MQENPVLPMTVVANTLAEMGETRARASMDAARLSGPCGREPGITAGAVDKISALVCLGVFDRGELRLDGEGM